MNASVPAPAHSITCSDLLWIFGFGRTGSTWVSQLLADAGRGGVWYEPHMGRPFLRSADPLAIYQDSPWFVLGGPPEHRILPIRAFILAAVHARFPTLKAGDLLILKDQNASMSAPLVTEATRESRLLVLVRDPRDVMASVADALRVAGSWARSQFPENVTGLDFDIETWSADYAAAMEAAFAAHDAHGGPKAIVTYEALCANTPAMLRRVCDDLRIAADDEQIAAAVRKND